MGQRILLHPPRVAAVYPHTPFEDAQIEQSISERFEKQVVAHPDRVAIGSRERSFSFDGMNRTANRLARTMLALRGGDAEAVALLFEHGADALAAMLAVLKAGKFYLVLDPSYPPDRLSYMLADSGAGLVITDTKNRPLLAQLKCGHLRAVNMDEVDECLSADNPEVRPAPDALAMLLYTSGSTGRPKGVMHSHRNVLVEVRNLTNAWCVSPHDRWLLHTSLSFANSVRTIYCALLNGGGVYPYDVKTHGFGGLPDWLRSERITIMRTIPTTFRNFMATLPPNQAFPDVRLLSIGGEPMYRGDVDAFNRHFAPSCVIAHGMGPTECFMVCLNYVAHGTRVVGSKLDIGWPVPDKEVLLRDDDGNEVPVGEVGEICVRSRHIALGYWRDAERTRAVFLPDPHDPDVRTYRTGDLGKRAANGCLTHVGRRDFQVKIRGFRIDVSEIEVAMRAIDGVRDAVVVGREDTVGEKRLVAYFVPATTAAATATSIRRGLALVLPEYMIPGAIVCLDAMPQTPNGKTDRLRLPAPLRERPPLETAFAAPTTPMERALGHVWSEVLAIDGIGIHDNFFELGGDSIRALNVVGRVRMAFDAEMPLRAMFESPTIFRMAKYICEGAPDAIDETRQGRASRVEGGVAS